MKTVRTERRQDRPSGVSVATRLPLTEYLAISNLLAAKGEAVGPWLRGLALEWLAVRAAPAVVSTEEMIERL
jgi:hypothetical protein